MSDGAPPEPPRPGQGGRAEMPGWATIALLLVVIFGVNALVVAVLPERKGATQRIDVPYRPVFLAQLRAGNVERVAAQGDTVQGTFRRSVEVGGDTARDFATEVPVFANAEQLDRLLEQQHVRVDATAPDDGSRSLGETLLVSFGPALLIVLFFILLMRGMGGGMRGAGAFGRSRARRVEGSEQRLTFKDVAGIDEAQAELAQIADFLRDPDRYRRLGARIPRGVLLTGPPGTGKTLLARALAGEAQVPFFSIAASEFVELYVGVGASRVRSLFREAKAAAPAIVFVDELDAIGRSRTSGPATGGHDEREQTLNQLLTELDGFDPSIGVIVLAATNRPEILDPALLRPGRFDRRVALQPPDTAGRRKILGVHVRSVPLGDDVDLDRLAAETAGMVGADLANVINEAALLAAARGRAAVEQIDVEDALEKLVLGSERRILLSSQERRRSAYHEAGHALVAMLTPGADPVRKVSIIPRGQALGVTLSAPEADRFSYDRTYLDGKLRVALGGRVAEELVFDDVTTGAQSDIREVTELARQMAGQWGMSDRIGPLLVTPPDGLGTPLAHGGETSEAMAQVLDEEVQRLVEDALDHVRALLARERDRLDTLAGALLERETLDEPAAYAAVGIEHHIAPARASAAT